MRGAFLHNSIRLLAASTSALQRSSIHFHPSSTSLLMSTSTSGVVGIDYPELVVFDLDACLWDQEMYTMSAMPSKTTRGDLNG